MKFQSRLLRSLGLFLPLLCAGVSGGSFNTVDVAPTQEYLALSPDEVYNQFPKALEQLDLVSQFLCGPDAPAHATMGRESWVKIENFHHILFIFLVYQKAGLGGANDSLWEQWVQVNSRHTARCSRVASHHHAQIARLLSIALGDPSSGPFYVTCEASHAIYEARVAPLLEAMSFLVRKRLELELRLQWILDVFPEHCRVHLSDATRQSISADIQAVDDLTSLIEQCHQEYLLTQQNAALDINSQAIIQAALDCVDTIFSKFKMSETARMYLFESFCQISMENAPELLELARQTFAKVPLRIKVGFPIGERLQAAYDHSPDYRDRLKEIGELAGWLGYLQLPDEAMDFDAKLLPWLVENECAVTQLEFNFFVKTDHTPITDLVCPGRSMPRKSFPSARQILNWLGSLSMMLQKLEDVLKRTRDCFSRAQMCWIFEYCFDGQCPSSLENYKRYYDELRMLAESFEEARKDQRFFSEESFKLEDEIQQAEFQHRVGNCHVEFERIARVYNALIIEFEHLPQCAVFETRPDHSRLMLSGWHSVKSARNVPSEHQD